MPGNQIEQVPAAADHLDDEQGKCDDAVLSVGQQLDRDP
jgi:hypothetical protein